jgi:fructose-1,6-bisphosphatase/sedoheptulose 1,7-bisphosphatase-like protein
VAEISLPLRPREKDQAPMDYSGISIGLAEGARFELAVHEVDAGFQDRFSARSNSLTTTAG